MTAFYVDAFGTLPDALADLSVLEAAPTLTRDETTIGTRAAIVVPGGALRWEAQPAAGSVWAAPYVVLARLGVDLRAGDILSDGTRAYQLTSAPDGTKGFLEAPARVASVPRPTTMPAPTYDIILEKGSKWTRTLTVSDSGTPRDLTGYTARMHIRETVGAASAVVELSSPSDGITISASTGEITLTISAVETAALSITSGYYDLEILPGVEADAQRILQGSVTISPEVTR